MTADGSDRSFGAPRFDVVLRGYDRRQVDEHLSRLQRLMGRMRNDLDTARSQAAGGASTPPGGRPRPTPRPRPDGTPGAGNDVVGTFTERMHAILQKAEEEAAEIRTAARGAVRAEEERAAAVRAGIRAEEDAARRTLAELARQRDAVLAELTRVRGQLEGLLSAPTTRITLPKQGAGPERREVGAGQPLPGTPDSAERPADGPGSAPVPVVGRTAARPVNRTAVFTPPGCVGPEQPAGESSDGPDEPPVERTSTLPAAERTALMEPVTDEPGDAPPRAEPARGEATQLFSPPRRGAAEAPPAQPVAADDDDKDADGEDRVEATQAAPASPARSG